MFLLQTEDFSLSSSLYTTFSNLNKTQVKKAECMCECANVCVCVCVCVSVCVCVLCLGVFVRGK